MKEKELRIALVCFGGVSLAVYMHGVSTEILKLARASAALHAVRNRAQRLASSFESGGEPDRDTETIYYELLRDFGKVQPVEVVVREVLAPGSAEGHGTLGCQIGKRTVGAVIIWSFDCNI